MYKYIGFTYLFVLIDMPINRKFDDPVPFISCVLKLDQLFLMSKYF